MAMFFGRVVSNLSSLITMFVFLTAMPNPHAPWRIVLVTLVAAVVVVTITADARVTMRSRAHVFDPNSPKIAAYMISWIKRGGRTAVVSRNLSWVDDAAKEVLETKAKSGDLALYVPKTTDLTTELAGLGATVCAHDGDACRSRFTIVNVGRGDARVAVGATADGKHVITEHGPGDPVLVMAHDLLDRLLRN
jgi:hypothetical protein